MLAFLRILRQRDFGRLQPGGLWENKFAASTHRHTWGENNFNQPIHCVRGRKVSGTNNYRKRFLECLNSESTGSWRLWSGGLSAAGRRAKQYVYIYEQHKQRNEGNKSYRHLFCVRYCACNLWMSSGRKWWKQRSLAAVPVDWELSLRYLVGIMLVDGVYWWPCVDGVCSKPITIDRLFVFARRRVSSTTGLQ